MEGAGINEEPTAATVSVLKDQPECFQQQVAALPYYLLHACSNTPILLPSKGSNSFPLHTVLEVLDHLLYVLTAEKSLSVERYSGRKR